MKEIGTLSVYAQPFLNDGMESRKRTNTKNSCAGHRKLQKLHQNNIRTTTVVFPNRFAPINIDSKIVPVTELIMNLDSSFR